MSRLRPLFKTVPQQADRDCVISCMSSLLDIPYTQILVVAAQVQPDVLKDGLTETAMVEVARRFKRTLVEGDVDFKRSIGILGVRFEATGRGHACVLSRGHLYDPEDQYVWQVKEYLRHWNGKVIDFYELEDE